MFLKYFNTSNTTSTSHDPTLTPSVQFDNAVLLTCYILRDAFSFVPRSTLN
ncbi:uncharacterized protein DS421_11g351660 [Arachis hypogaea]|nr:uncharacterized protein DS421_11g351660 [Arachis hypogaea]